MKKEMKFTERRTLQADTLRRLCIKKNWYTIGTNEEYCNLFSLLRENYLSAEMTAERLALIAADIMEHSDADDCADGYLEITDIMHDLAKACDTVFTEL